MFALFPQCERKLKQKASLPPKYALELLTIYAWEKEGRAQDFDLVEGFRTVLELVIQYQHLCIFWTVNYSLKDESKVLRNFLLDQMKRTRCSKPLRFLTLFPPTLFRWPEFTSRGPWFYSSYETEKGTVLTVRTSLGLQGSRVNVVQEEQSGKDQGTRSWVAFIFLGQKEKQGFRSRSKSCGSWKSVPQK